MKTSEKTLLLTRYEGFVRQQIKTLTDLVRGGHFEAASGLAETVQSNVDKFGKQLEELPSADDQDLAKGIHDIGLALQDVRGRLDALEAPKP